MQIPQPQLSTNAGHEFVKLQLLSLQVVLDRFLCIAQVMVLPSNLVQGLRQAKARSGLADGALLSPNVRFQRVSDGW